MASLSATLKGTLAKVVGVLINRRRFFQLWLTIIMAATSAISFGIEATWKPYRLYNMPAVNCTASCSFLCGLPPSRFRDEASSVEASYHRLESLYFSIVPRDIMIRRHVNETYWLDPRARVRLGYLVCTIPVKRPSTGCTTAPRD
jgi:hypothetical protein